MRPPGGNSIEFESETICHNVCYRSFSMNLDKVENTGIAYRVRVTRPSNSQVEVIPPLRKGLTIRFWTDLQADKDYTFEFLCPDVAPLPQVIRFETGDASTPCTIGDFRFRLVLNGFQVSSPMRYLLKAKLYNTCGPPPSDISYYYDTCSGLTRERQFVIPGGVPVVKDGISMLTTGESADCINDRAC